MLKYISTITILLVTLCCFQSNQEISVEDCVVLSVEDSAFLSCVHKIGFMLSIELRRYHILESKGSNIVMSWKYNGYFILTCHTFVSKTLWYRKLKKKIADTFSLISLSS